LPLSLGAIRQTYSMPFVFLATVLYMGRRYPGALILLLVACSFHLSAAVVFVGFLVTHVFLSAYREKLNLGVVPRVAILFLTLKLLVVLALVLVVRLVFGEGGVDRLGETHFGTDFIGTGGVGRDIMIFVERGALSLLAIRLLMRGKGRIVPLMATLSIAGTL